MLMAEIMSRPVVTATRTETVADAASRMREQGVGSVVVADGDRAVGILTERDLVRVASAGADPATETVDGWMTPDPDCVASDIDATAAFASLAEHGYRHIPVVDGERLVGLVSMRDLMRVAQIQPADNLAHEVPRGLEGVVVAETAIGDVRGLEGFYHYREYNAVELAEKRTLEDVWYLLFEGRLPTLAERGGVPTRDRADARDPRVGEGGAPRHRPRRGGRATARSAAHHRLTDGRRARVPAVTRRRCRGVARAGPASVRGRAHVADRAVPAAKGPRGDRPRSCAALRGQLPVHDARQCRES